MPVQKEMHSRVRWYFGPLGGYRYEARIAELERVCGLGSAAGAGCGAEQRSAVACAGTDDVLGLLARFGTSGVDDSTLIEYYSTCLNDMQLHCKPTSHLSFNSQTTCRLLE
jgi:hypothetical protein